MAGNSSSESGLNSDRSGRKKLREKFARKFRQRRYFMSDFSESNVVVSNARNKISIVAAMEELTRDVSLGCCNINNMIRSWTDTKSDHPERIREVVAGNMKLMTFLNGEVDALIQKFTKSSSPMSSNSSIDSVSDPSVQVANKSNKTTAGPSASNSSGIELFSPRKKSRKSMNVPNSSDPEQLLNHLCHDVTESIGPVFKFVLQCKAEELDTLTKISKQLSFVMDDIRTTLEKANNLSPAANV